MTVTSELDIVAAPVADDAAGSYVDWPAIIGGIVLASAISILMLTFGSAVGLSFTNFNARPDVSPIWLAIAAASWLLWVQISSFMAGAYLTGRLRKRHGDATESESDVRDGAHGLLVWGGALIVGAVLAVGGIGATANVVGSTAATLTTAASNVAGGAAEAAGEALDPNAYFVDTLFRAPAGDAATAEAAATTEPAPAATATETPATTTTTEAPAGTTTAQSTTTTTAPAATTTSTPATTTAGPAATDAAVSSADREAVRGEVGRIFARAAVTEVPETDRVYLAQLVADQTGMSDEEATARVDDVMTAMETAKTEAAEAAETARKTAVIAAFLVAASLLVSAIGAYWAAQRGGNHRDNETELSGWFRRF